MLLFKRRQRNYKPEQSPYELIFDTIKIENGHLNAQVKNVKNSVLFTLDLYLLKENRFRFRMDELNPLKKRYQVDKEVIIDDLEQEKYAFIFTPFLRLIN